MRNVLQILDIPKTLEVLETQGVAVVGHQCDEFPAFFTRKRGQPAHCRVDDMLLCALCHCLTKQDVPSQRL